jgi:hypothetical protein
MSLPQLVSPEFTMEIPSTKQKIKFRPFLVKEEKILLMAMESGDQSDVSRTVEQILNNCILDDIDISKLATFDIEYLFLQLRGKSVGEVIELQLKHTKKDSECKHITQFNLNLDDIKVKGDISDGKIMLDDKIGVKVNYPTYKTIADLSKRQVDDQTEMAFKTIAMMVEYVYDKENVYSDFTEDEMEDWINQLNQKQFEKITSFVQDAPKLKQDIEWTCNKCGEKDKITLEGLQSFFT